MKKPLPDGDLTDAQFRAFLAENGYYAIRQLPDGTWAALIRLMFTTGMCVGIHSFGWTRRYCYENECNARGALADLQAWDDAPEPTYVARRGEI